jgi:hypothetical protein
VVKFDSDTMLFREGPRSGDPVGIGIDGDDPGSRERQGDCV